MSRRCWLIAVAFVATLALLATAATGEQAGSRSDAVRAGSLDVGNSHSCLILAAGNVDCWGSDIAGQLGDDAILATKPAPTPVALSGHPVVALSGGETDTCAILDDGSARCWGSDTEGQLGDDGLFVSKATPVVVDLPAGRLAVAISVGDHHACAILDDGSARCWGGDSHGELGDDANLANRPTPVPVALPAGRRAVAISAGGYQACAILDDGGATCWGSDAEGQLGDGDPALADKPTPVPAPLPPGRRAVAISNGQYHTCAILDDGSASCWGYGSMGQLGNGQLPVTQSRPTTVVLPAGRTAVAISAGGYSTCAVLDDGSASCWGADAQGQLGNDETRTDRSTPVPVALPSGRRAVAISTGGVHACASLDDGSVRCWGYNGAGQLGSATGSLINPVASDVPAALPEGSAARLLADLSVGLEGAPAELTAGAAAMINVRLTNAGPDPATGIRVLLAASHLALAPSAIGQGSLAGGTWQVGSLGAGAQATLTVSAIGVDPGAATLATEVVAQGERDPDSSPANGVAGEDDQASVGIAVVAPPTAPAPGTPTTPPTTAPVRYRVDRLTLKLSTRRDRTAPFTVTASGQLLASAVAARTGCAGTVVVTGKAAIGKKTTRNLVSRRVRLKLVRGTCTYTAALRVTRTKRGKARRMTITAGFAGNAVLLTAAAKRTTFRLG